MKKFVFTYIISILFSVAALAQEDYAARLIKACVETESINCDFIQKRTSPMMNEAIVFKGKMSYRKPAQLEWTYTSPEFLTFRMNGSEISITRGKDGDVSDLSTNKMFKEMTKLLMGAVSGELLADEKLFSSEISADSNTITASLTPKKHELKRMWANMTMVFELPTYKATHIVITEAGGATTTIDFKYR